jgi:hypothetical protein
MHIASWHRDAALCQEQLVIMQQSLARMLHASGISLNKWSVTRHASNWSAARACIDVSAKDSIGSLQFCGAWILEGRLCTVKLLERCLVHSRGGRRNKISLWVALLAVKEAQDVEVG